MSFSSSSSIAHSAITSGSSRTKNIDADEPIEDSDDDSSDEEDETADLLAELNKVCLSGQDLLDFNKAG